MRAASGDAHAQSDPEKAIKPEANAILAKVRETYRTLTTYHFERVLRAEEAKEDGKWPGRRKSSSATAGGSVT